MVHFNHPAYDPQPEEANFDNRDELDAAWSSWAKRNPEEAARWFANMEEFA